MEPAAPSDRGPAPRCLAWPRHQEPLGPDRRNRLVTDERAKLIRELRRLAAAHGLRPAVRAYRADGLVITPLPVVHTSHPAYGYLIGASGTRTAWAPEFLFPSWAAGADLMFAEAAGWARPIRFAEGAGGHAPALEVAEQAARHGVLRLVFAHKRTPTAGPFTVHPQRQVQAHHLHGHPLRARFPKLARRTDVRPGLAGLPALGRARPRWSACTCLRGVRGSWTVRPVRGTGRAAKWLRSRRRRSWLATPRT